MDPSEFSDPIFIVDLNELKDDGDHIPVAMDYTLNLGARVRSSRLPRPALGQWVMIHSDEDDALYWARVDRQINERDFLVKIDWQSGVPVLNEAWSSRLTTNYISPKDSLTSGSSTNR